METMSPTKHHIDQLIYDAYVKFIETHPDITYQQLYAMMTAAVKRRLVHSRKDFTLGIKRNRKERQA